jgi:hypothetical protein
MRSKSAREAQNRLYEKRLRASRGSLARRWSAVAAKTGQRGQRGGVAKQLDQLDQAMRHLVDELQPHRQARLGASRKPTRHRAAIHARPARKLAQR